MLFLKKKVGKIDRKPFVIKGMRKLLCCIYERITSAIMFLYPIVVLNYLVIIKIKKLGIANKTHRDIKMKLRNVITLPVINTMILLVFIFI